MSNAAEIAELREHMEALLDSSPVFEATLSLAVKVAGAMVTTAKDCLSRLAVVEAQHSERMDEVRRLLATLDAIDASRGRA